MAELQEALAIIHTHPDEAHFVGPRSDALIARAERVLGLRFPPSYRRFLQALGAGHFGAEEFYGVIESDFEQSGVPDGVWYTLRSRRDSSLPSEYVVVYNDGMGGLFVIDTSQADENGESPLYVWEPGGTAPGDELEYVNSDFGSFILDCVRTEIA